MVPVKEFIEGLLRTVNLHQHVAALGVARQAASGTGATAVQLLGPGLPPQQDQGVVEAAPDVYRDDEEVLVLSLNEVMLQRSQDYKMIMTVKEFTDTWGPQSFQQVHTNQRSVLYISVGSSHICLVDERGDLYTQGDNRYGQLGSGDRVDRGQLTRVAVSMTLCPVDVWCGLHHTLVLLRTESGAQELHGCGCGAGGRLPGHPKGSDVLVKLDVQSANHQGENEMGGVMRAPCSGSLKKVLSAVDSAIVWGMSPAVTPGRPRGVHYHQAETGD
ncbi:hypothetical protein CRUP_017819 [Coryphaenoides rupestris]|nr:hypothetical protein CRUP_017819 [Coryphaenoides rupestris]